MGTIIWNSGGREIAAGMMKVHHEEKLKHKSSHYC